MKPLGVRLMDSPSRKGYIIDFERLGAEGTMCGTANAGEGPKRSVPQ